ncbi:PAS domain S-box protein [Silvibacterium sp.]|uniref:PAS domain S-box protein n=1 Tax=Silvibacterium sp. TaxID=1964179 RepID=UPI0039E3BCC8
MSETAPETRPRELWPQRAAPRPDSPRVDGIVPARFTSPGFELELLSRVSALVVALDRRGCVVCWNPAAEQRFGVAAAEALGQPFPLALFADASLTRAPELLALEPGAVPGPGIEVSMLGADGGECRIAWRRDVNPAAEPVLVLTGTDVSGRYEREKRLRASEAQARLLVEGSLGMICTHDLNGYLLSINPYAAANLGYKPEELVGRYMLDFIHLDHTHGWQSYWDSMATRGEDEGLLYVNRKDGSLCVIAFRNKLVQIAGAEPFVIGHGIDLTAKIEAEDKLHAIMRQRESILDSVGDGIYGLDLEGCIVFINRVGAKMLGYTPEELQGQPIHRLVHHSYADGTPYPESECPVFASLRRESPVRVRDEVFWRRDGSSIPVEYVACPLVHDGRATGSVVVFQDVTERRQLDRMKDEFISTVSHELRTPLTSLRAALGLLSSGSLEGRPEKTEQMLELAMSNCNRLVFLVNDILDFERIGAGRLHLDRTAVRAEELLREAVQRQTETANRAGLRIRVDAEPVKLWVDSGRIVQAISRLLSNAIKFSPPNTEIALRAHAVSDAEALIEVHDHGRGIPAEMLDTIFDRFRQGDASDSRASGGTGMGLALARGLVDLHGGRIWAESTIGLGSSFFLTLPRIPHDLETSIQ